MKIEEAVRRFQLIAGAEVKVADFYPSQGETRRPYRYAWVRLTVPNVEAVGRSAEIVQVAIEVDGHATVMTHYVTDDGREACQFEIAVSRDLEPDELREAGFHSLEVTLEDAVRS